MTSSTIRDAAPGKLKDLLDKTAEGDWDVDTVAAAIDAETMFYRRSSSA